MADPEPLLEAIRRNEAAILASFAVPPPLPLAKCARCGRLSAVVDIAGCCPECDPAGGREPVPRYDDHGPVTKSPPVMTGRGRWRCWCGRRFWTWRGYEAHWRQVRG
jgi:hypothetical protein